MEIHKILSQLEYAEGFFPEQAVQEAIARSAEITPFLLKTLEDVAAHPEHYLDYDGRVIHIFSLLLLAQFRERRAYPLIVRIFSAPGEMVFDLFGDVVTAILDSCLAAVCGGDMEGIRALAENEEANEYVRGAAIDSLVILISRGERSRDGVMAYFLSLFRKLKRKPSLAWDCLAKACSDIWPSEAMVEIRRAFRMGVIDEEYIDLEEIEKQLRRGKDAALLTLQEEYGKPLDTAQIMSKWDCFQKQEREPTTTESVRSSVPALDVRRPGPERRSQPAVGRNEPCPCGSGKKFKKCCGA